MITLAGLFLLLASAPPQAGNPIPTPIAPVENPTTVEKAMLGKILFWEEQLSSDDTVSCGTCHTASVGFTDTRSGIHPGNDGSFGTPDDSFGSPGVARQDASLDFVPDPSFRFAAQITGRRTQDVFGALYATEAFWDGRATDTFIDPVTGLVSIVTGGALESQIAGPPVSSAEMAHEGRDWTQIVTKISGSRPLALASDLPPDIASAIAVHGDYATLFDWAFGSAGITAERIIFAIASYERTLVPDQAPWALWMAGNTTAMTPDQLAGFNQFNTIARCNQCHSGPMFTDNQFHNMGLRPIAQDNGRQGVTGLFADRGKFKTPSLLNAGLRSRYFHTGQETALMGPGGPGPGPGPGPGMGGVAGFYVAGGGPFLDNKDPLLLPIGGTPGLNMMQVMDFVGNALTDPRVAAEIYPFDRPTLRSERDPVGSNLYGIATVGRIGSEQLSLIAHLPAVAGSTMRVGVRGGPAGMTALVGASFAPGFGQQLQGISYYLGSLLTPLIPCFLSDDGAGNGIGTVHAAVPDRSALIGRTLYIQAFLADPLAPTGATASQAGIFVIY